MSKADEVAEDIMKIGVRSTPYHSFAGGNVGNALHGKYVAESNQAIAAAINQLALATQALANRPIQITVQSPAPPKAKS